MGAVQYVLEKLEKVSVAVLMLIALLYERSARIVVTHLPFQNT
jgi:hypothetical protein